MLVEFVIPATVILVFCYFAIPSFQHGVDNRIHQTKKILNNTRADLCLQKSNDHCPMSSYKQCTNNVKKHKRCDCEDQRSFETCDQHKKLLKNQPKQKLIPVKYPKGRDRVNMYAPQNTEFNKLSIVKNRTHPYVSDL